MVKNNRKASNNKQNFSRKRKRKSNVVIPGVPKTNKKTPVDGSPASATCSSKRKLASTADDTSPLASENDFFMILHFQVLFNELTCPDCAGCIGICDDKPKCCGFVHCIIIKCSTCDWMKTFYTSPPSISPKKNTNTPQTQGRRTFDVNVRAVIGFQEIGCGLAAMETFSSIMNIKCLSKQTFYHLNKEVMQPYKNTALRSMKTAAAEVVPVDVVDNIPCARISIDGSWQKRGHSSLHGVVTAISGDKCIDVEVKSRHCYGCKMWEAKKDTPEYLVWQLNHDCQINHEKSSGAMESAGTVDIFNRSLANYGLMYKEYLGDGDTSSFNDVIKSNPYKDHNLIPIKLECIGHVQKRLGTR